MKLNELVGVKRYKDKTPDQVAMDASWYGFERIGQGTHAIAFLKDDIVYKFWAYDNPYTDFVAFCHAFPSHFLPDFKSRVKSIPTFFLKAPEMPDKISYVKMEKLEKLDHKLKIQLTDTVAAPFSAVIEALPRGSMPLEYDTFFEKLIGGRPMKSTDKLVPETQDLLDLLKQLMTLGKKKGYGLDLHESNIMQRGTTPVIIDPFATDENVLKNSAWEKYYTSLITQRKATDV